MLSHKKQTETQGCIHFLYILESLSVLAVKKKKKKIIA